MWLGSSQQVRPIDIVDILVMSSHVKVVNPARDLGVVIDSHLTLSTLVATLCRVGFLQLSVH